jgi:hypothetical protein
MLFSGSKKKYKCNSFVQNESPRCTHEMMRSSSKESGTDQDEMSQKLVEPSPLRCGHKVTLQEHHDHSSQPAVIS